jgi:hypothetical protein
MLYYARPCSSLRQTASPASHGLRTIINAAPGLPSTGDTNDDAPRMLSRTRALTHIIHLHNRSHPSRLPDSNKLPLIVLRALLANRACIPSQHRLSSPAGAALSSHVGKHFPAKLLQAQRLLPGLCSPSPVLSHAPPLAARMSLNSPHHLSPTPPLIHPWVRGVWGKRQANHALSD